MIFALGRKDYQRQPRIQIMAPRGGSQRGPSLPGNLLKQLGIDGELAYEILVDVEVGETNMLVAMQNRHHLDREVTEEAGAEL